MPLHKGILRITKSKTSCFGLGKMLPTVQKDRFNESKTSCFGNVMVGDALLTAITSVSRCISE